ncbi:MAG: hypothetical protein H6585_05010 [Flavobacteriales bacterium]|nr:hypothetical protein [Flavobacteriales bacterium]MCB9447688.1 hypothetical protein [Flavobacteriales bacterium]
MHTIEPFYSWDNLYVASEDSRSPFFEREYSEFEFEYAIYDHLIHPQWDTIGSPTLFIKILYVDYDEGYAIIELMGEWNDCLHNDIMTLKRDIIELIQAEGINKFILIGENVLNFHASDDCYYEEWFDEVEDGWIAALNFRSHVLEEFRRYNIDSYFLMDGALNMVDWRTYRPDQLYGMISLQVRRRLGA